MTVEVCKHERTVDVTSVRDRRKVLLCTRCNASLDGGPA